MSLCLLLMSLRNKVLLKQGANKSTPTNQSCTWLPLYFVIWSLNAGTVSSPTSSHLSFHLHGRYCHHNIHSFKSYSQILLLLSCLGGFPLCFGLKYHWKTLGRDLLPFGDWGCFPKEHRIGITMFFRTWLFYYITAQQFISFCWKPWAFILFNFISLGFVNRKTGKENIPKFLLRDALECINVHGSWGVPGYGRKKLEPRDSPSITLCNVLFQSLWRPVFVHLRKALR